MKPIDRRRSGSRGRKGPLSGPNGEVTAPAETLAHPDGNASRASSAPVDPISERFSKAVVRAASELRVELIGRVWLKLKTNKSGHVHYEVHAGRAKLGSVQQDEMIRCDDQAIASLFLLTRSVCLDVVRPPDGVTWSQWSGPMFAAGWALGHLMDAALSEIRLAERSGRSVAPESLAYQVIASDKSEQDALRERAAKECARTKQDFWKYRSEFTISGATCSCAGQQIVVALKRWRKGEIGCPSWVGPRVSIPLRADNVRMRMDERERLVLSFNAIGQSQSCIVSPKGGNAWAAVRKVLSGEFQHGAARLLWDERKRRWQVRLSYKMPRQAPVADGSGVLVVRRSAEHMLFAMNSDGRVFGESVGIGRKILAVKGQFLRRKRMARKSITTQGKGARGHGKNRFFRRYQALADREDLVVDTMLKQHASFLRKAAEQSQATTVLLEDFSLPWTPTGSHREFLVVLERMPWGRQEAVLRTEFEEHGIAIRKIASTHRSDTCPACGHSTEIDRDLVDCAGCGLLCDRHAVAAWHMMKAGGFSDDKIARKYKHVSRAMRDLRKLARDAEHATQAAE